MSKRVLTAFVLLLAGVAAAAWQSVGGPQGSAQVAIIEQGAAGTVFEVTVPGVEVTPVTVGGQAFNSVTLPGEVMAVLDEGKPQVPKVSVLLGTPTGARVSCQVVSRETETFDLAGVVPLQPPLLDNQPPAPLAWDRAFYAQNTDYPGSDLALINTGVWRDLSVANLQVYPVQVNPAAGTVTVTTRIRVRVEYAGGTYPLAVADWMIPQYNRYVDNFSHLGIGAETDYSSGVRYLVICNQTHSTNAFLTDSLLGWVKARGYDTRTIVKSSFTAQEIKDSIRAEYNRNTPKTLHYVLLVGEYSEIPMGSYSGVGRSDYWYTDLEPWPSGDNYPEVALGRFSPDSAGDLRNQIRKSLKYQKDPATAANWLTKIRMPTHKEQYPGKYSGCTRGIYNMPKPYFPAVDIDTIMGQYQTNAAVTTAINAGVGIVAYRGHGDYQEWYQWDQSNSSWFNSHIDALANGDLTPVVYNIACNNGDIYQSECLSERWMGKYPGGAVANFGATQASYTYPNHGICSTLVRATTDTWTITVPGVRNYGPSVYHLSDIKSYGVDAYVAKYWPGSPYPYNIWMYVVLGDPSMPVWTGGMPAAATVTCPDSVPLGAHNLNVTVRTGGNAVERALVCAWKGGEVYVAERTDASGVATLAVNASTTGPMSVTVSEGHARHSTPGVEHTPILPYQKTVYAGGSPPPPGQFVVNVDTGSVLLSVCAIGSIGYDEPTTDAGAGFKVPKAGANTLFFGSMMAGNSPTYLVDHFYGRPANGTTNHDWVAGESLSPVIPPAPADERWRGVMTDAGHASPKGIECEQNWYMNAEAQYDDWAIVTYDFENSGASPVNGFYAGLIADFDIGSSPTANTVVCDTANRRVYMRQSATENPCAGFVLLEPNAFANIGALDHARYVYPTDSCVTDNQKYRMLNGGILQRNSNRAYDWSCFVSAGPRDLPVGSDWRVAIAVVGATSASEWNAAAQAAQEWYNANLLGISEEERRIEVSARRPLLLSPNPFRTGTYLHYFASRPGRVELLAFDAMGRVAEQAGFDVAAGTGRLYWRPNSLARGIYFLKVRSPDASITSKVMVLE